MTTLAIAPRQGGLFRVGRMVDGDGLPTALARPPRL